MIDKDTASARVNVANVLYRAGYDGHKILNLIDYPVCIGMTFNPLNDKIQFNQKPDDDAALFIQEPGRKDEREIPGSNKKRNVTWYNAIVFVRNEDSRKEPKDKLLNVGNKVIVKTFDGWVGSWRNKKWTIDFLYIGSKSEKVTGGNRNNGVSARPAPSPFPPDYYNTGPHFEDYYENGYAYIPPLEPWPWVEWLAPDEPETA